MFQYRDFSAERYANDATWILENKGFLPSELKTLIQTISKNTAEKIIKLKSLCVSPEKITLLPMFTFSAKEISTQSGLPIERVENILSSFSLPSIPCNSNFLGIGDYNQTHSHPIIRYRIS